MTSITAFLPNIGVPELLIVLGILILILGPKQIPKAARSLGKGLRGFRDSVEGKDEAGDLPEKSESSKPNESQGDEGSSTSAQAGQKDETRA